ncbi:MAG: hypothetical protein R3353_01690, partial [Salegentibacter mishustinae]|nr:hypothetical protein [Salegentibacter mishustinae]
PTEYGPSGSGRSNTGRTEGRKIAIINKSDNPIPLETFINVLELFFDPRKLEIKAITQSK